MSTKPLLLLVILLLACVSSDVGAVQLSKFYDVNAEEGCTSQEGGSIRFNFDEHRYFYKDEQGNAASGDFRFYCDGRFRFEDELGRWGEGAIQEDGTILFVRGGTCGLKVQLTPKAKASVLRFFD